MRFIPSENRVEVITDPMLKKGLEVTDDAAAQVARAASDIDAARLQVVTALDDGPGMRAWRFRQAVARAHGAADRLLANSRHALDAAEPVSTSFFGNTAIGGQDTVSYHDPAVRQAHKVRAGDARFEVAYLGASWRFASRESAERFAADPAKYVPHYNGFCANALALGEGLIKTDGTVSNT